MSNVFIKPAVEGAHVPDPHTHAGLKAEGEWKPASDYWLRRLRDEDVVETEAPAPAAPVEETARKRRSDI
jgi:hypothetical protein